jgi:hypothetical protein
MSKGSVGSKSVDVVQASVSCGIDVSAASLAVAVLRDGKEGFEEREFPNTDPGHRQLIAWLGRNTAPARVCGMTNQISFLFVIPEESAFARRCTPSGSPL